MWTWVLGHSKGTWALKALKTLKALKALKALGHSRHLGTWALKALGHSKGTWALGNPRHLDTWALRYLGIRAPERHSGTQSTRGTLFNRHVKFLKK